MPSYLADRRDDVAVELFVVNASPPYPALGALDSRQRHLLSLGDHHLGEDLGPVCIRQRLDALCQRLNLCLNSSHAPNLVGKITTGFRVPSILVRDRRAA